MHKDKIVILDLDDTLSNFRHEMMEILNARTGFNHHWKDWSVLHVEPLYNMTNEEFLKIAYETHMLERSRPHMETIAFMRNLKEKGVKTRIVTARGWHPRAKAMTENWLGLYDVPYDELVICNLFENKAEFIKSEDNVLLTIEDSPAQSNNYARMETNRPEYVFAYHMPWNTGDVLDKSVIRIDSLHDVTQHIEGL